MRSARPVVRLAVLALGVCVVPVAHAWFGKPSTAAQVIVDNELAFQKSVVERGQRDGFLAWLADSAVVFQPRPTPARALYESQPDSGAQLRWKPDLAMVSGNGDFGWATGPWMLWQKSTSERAGATGHYLTVWRRQGDGSWRVLLDGGTPYPVADDRRPGHLQVTPRLREPGGGKGKAAGCTEAFVQLWKDEGRKDALDEFVADDVRLMQSGAPPLDGEKAARRRDALAKTTLTSGRITKSLSSAGGDVVVTYGEYAIAATPDMPARRFVFVHAWDVGGKCRLALELANLVGDR